MESVILNLIHSLGSIQVYILDKVHKHGIHHNWKGFCKYNKKSPEPHESNGSGDPEQAIGDGSFRKKFQKLGMPSRHMG